ncbi:MAG: shikimate dehydrogenase [Rhodospirillaceae bacterium]|jgi:shikimate dehydrogenase|nr:shikimate dehydrogenase [Rhodospirillaceae bacterium]MBT4687881.1 shikimate dehydrogenase [Rhodospirillaceae bacterium]MBT5079475.1 shikimate dehydrogenase [Rhodospirillaceae bacterium]MBT5523361.1 shikimate dehydrogenase [Rhodospirillaceae bacterium]MBT5877546.1 shikimate dehydrogenase [Rhodospirillaceae bacterium]
MISGATRLAGVTGWPIAHSRSPRLHNYWLRDYGIDGAYLPLAIRPEDFEQAIRALPKLGFAGCNVTMPHKEAALRVVDRVDPVAKRIGAVNTIVVAEDGGLDGSNTDAFGFIQALTEGAPDLDLTEGPAILLGAGGAAKAIAVALLDAGVPELIILNRTEVRARDLAASLEDGRIVVRKWDARTGSLAEANFVINSTTQGMQGQAPLDLALDDLAPEAVVMDAVYTPLLTSLLAGAKARGNHTVDGLGMLLHQARPGFAAWFGREPVVDQGLRDHILADL